MLNAGQSPHPIWNPLDMTARLQPADQPLRLRGADTDGGPDLAEGGRHPVVAGGVVSNEVVDGAGFADQGRRARSWHLNPYIRIA